MRIGTVGNPKQGSDSLDREIKVAPHCGRIYERAKRATIGGVASKEVFCLLEFSMGQVGSRANDDRLEMVSFVQDLAGAVGPGEGFVVVEASDQESRFESN